MSDPSDPETAVTVGPFVRGIAARSGDREAVVNGERRITYRQLDDDSRRMARCGLLARGVTKGTRIGLWLGNGPEWVVAWAAVCRVGAIAVPLSTFFKDRELARTIRHADLQGVVATARSSARTRWRGWRRRSPSCRARTAHDLVLHAAPYLRWIVSIDDTEMPSWCRPLSWLADGAEGTVYDEALLAEVESEVHPTDTAIMIYTSGSTSDHKGVPHTHRNIMDKTRYLRDMMKFDDSVRAYTPSPFFWVGGLTMSLFPVLGIGGTQLCTDRFDAEEVLELFERARHARQPLSPSAGGHAGAPRHGDIRPLVSRRRRHAPPRRRRREPAPSTRRAQHRGRDDGDVRRLLVGTVRCAGRGRGATSGRATDAAARRAASRRRAEGGG